MRRSHPGLAALLWVTAAIVLLPQSGRAGGDPAPRAAGWSSIVQRQIAVEEYEVTWQAGAGPASADASWQAPNRAHGFRTYFTNDGIRLIPRTDGEPSWRWGLELTGYGRGDLVWPVPGGVSYPERNRIDLWRGEIVEWYVNEPRGLEQGFTLSARPEETGRTGTEPATTVAPSGPRAATPDAFCSERAAYLELALTGTLQPSTDDGGQAIDFRTGGGTNVLRYSGLKVTDATGRTLASWMELQAAPGKRRIRLVFDDEEAIYPLTVDPIATNFAWNADGDQDGVRLGYSVGTAGDVNDDGYADLIVGAPWYDNGEADEGRAYLYLGSEEFGLLTTPAWTAEGGQEGAHFGYSVGTAGDVNHDGFADVIVGAPGYDVEQLEEARTFAVLEDAGAAFVYHGLEGEIGLTTTPAWTAEGDQAGAAFAHSVGTAGDVNADGNADVVVGAPLYDVAGSDETVVDAGRAYVYHGPGLSEDEAWIAEGDQAYAQFGKAVGTAGDVDGGGYDDLVVGAPLYDGTEIDEGRAYLYVGSSTGLEETDWEVVGGQGYANFGGSLGTAGDVNGDDYDDIIVGAFRYSESEGGEGRAFVYHGSSNGPGTEADWTAESGQAWAYFGAAVATAGDVDGDGYSDVVVGAYGYDARWTDAGRIYLYQGSGGGLTTFPVRFTDGVGTGVQFGKAVGPAGDVNGDGFADVVVGMPYYDGAGWEVGRAIVYHGALPVLTQTLCANLGDAPPIEVEEGVFEPVEIDQDLFTFDGTQTEEVTVTLAAVDGEGRASLYLMDDMGDLVELFEADRTDLPISITATLPASGEYLIAVTEQPDVAILPGLPFSGDYCLTLVSTLGASGSLEPTDSVEAEDEPATEPASADDATDRVISPVRLPRIGVKRRPLSR